MVSGDRSAIISISGTRARKDQSIHEWSKAPRISITGRHYHARKSRSLAAWWGLLAAGLTGGALTAANRQAGEAPDQLRPRLPVARRPPVLALAGPHRTPHRAVGTATVVGRESGRYASRIRFFSLLSGRLVSSVHAQPATARRAITPTRCPRYSALAWMSELSPSCGIAMSLMASGVKDRASAVSISGTRKTQGPAPVTATRTFSAVRATKTPTMA